MTTADSKVRVKTDEQVRKKKRKRPETHSSQAKRKKLQKLKGDNQDVKSRDKETEHSWSSVNIENERELMAMGLASLEVIDEDADSFIMRPGKRKRTKAPKSEEDSAVSPSTTDKSSNVDSACSDQRALEKASKLEEKREKLRVKRRERQAQLRLKRLNNPDLEKEKERKEKLKIRRKAKRAQKKHEKQLVSLKSDFDQFITETRRGIEENLVKSSETHQDVSQSGVTESQTSETVSQTSETVSQSGETVSQSGETVSQTSETVSQISETVSDKAEGDVSSDSGDTRQGGGEEEMTSSGDTATVDSAPVELSVEEKVRGAKWVAMGVCEPIVKGLLDLGFLNPTPIQEACIPAGLLKYKDVIGAAETGSGKTLAFGIPLIQRVMKLSGEGAVRGLVLCPTRELALQVTEHLVAAAKYTGVRITPIVGGIATPKQERLLSYKPPILVATPGRLWQLIQERSYLQDLTSVKFLVVDEADRMVEDGHFDEVTQIISRLPKPDCRNTFLFSATLAFTIDRLDEKAKKKKKTKQEKRSEKRGSAGLDLLVRNIGVRDKVEKVDLTLKRGTAELLTETYFLCNIEDKDLHLYYLLLNHPGKTLVFANSIDGVMNLVHIMKLLELQVYPLHSSLQQRQRFKFLEKFKATDNAALICTDIAARGLDIPEVDTVVHYQLPATREAYIHRSGRTARADNPGLSIAVVGPKDFKSYKKVASQMTEFPIELTRLRVLRPPLQQARKIFKIERLQTRPEKKEAKLVALAKEADLEAEVEDVGASTNTKREVKVMKQQLKSLLSQPVLDPLNSVRYNTRVGALKDLQTVSTFSLGVSALKHSNKKMKKV